MKPFVDIDVDIDGQVIIYNDHHSRVIWVWRLFRDGIYVQSSFQQLIQFK